MKKAKKRVPNLSLKKLREIIGANGEPMTQKQFASMVGVSLPLIKAVESGQVPLTEKLQRNIEIATGAIFAWPHYKETGLEIERAPNGEVWGAMLHVGGGRLSRDYSRAHWERHQRFYASDDHAANLALKEAMPALEALFTAAAKPGVAGAKHRLPSLRASLQEWMREANENFKLGVRIVTSARFSIHYTPRLAQR